MTAIKNEGGINKQNKYLLCIYMSNKLQKVKYKQTLLGLKKQGSVSFAPNQTEV